MQTKVKVWLTRALWDIWCVPLGWSGSRSMIQNHSGNTCMASSSPRVDCIRSFQNHNPSDHKYLNTIHSICQRNTPSNWHCLSGRVIFSFELVRERGDNCCLMKTRSSCTLSTLIMPTIPPSWLYMWLCMTIMLLFCPTRLMVMPFMITTAARLSSLVSHSKPNARELWGTIQDG